MEPEFEGEDVKDLNEDDLPTAEELERESDSGDENKLETEEREIPASTETSAPSENLTKLVTRSQNSSSQVQTLKTSSGTFTVMPQAG